MHQSVCVINQNGRVLMPTTPRKARLLERSGKAEVVGYRPYTIKLLYPTRGHIQPISLGIDAGYLHIGFSAVTESKDQIGGELDLLQGMSERITEKARYRRVRRSRLRHRPARFDNRNRSEGWLAPSIQHKYDAHLKMLERITSRLPILKITIELAPFDIQKIKNPEISGTEYQQGEQLGYANLTAYIRHRDGYQCQNSSWEQELNLCDNWDEYLCGSLYEQWEPFIEQCANSEARLALQQIALEIEAGRN